MAQATTHEPTRIKIVSRWDASIVLFECDVPDGIESGMAMRHALEKAVESRANLSDANLSRAYLSGANLSDAYLSRANLSDANLSDAYLSRANLSDANLSDAYLSGANLSDANLSRANLSGAKWTDAIVIQKAPIQISGLHWFVTILDDHMQIGCEIHTLAEWSALDDARIVDMDGREALRFWRAHKAALLSLARSAGRGCEVAEVSEAV